MIICIYIYYDEKKKKKIVVMYIYHHLPNHTSLNSFSLISFGISINNSPSSDESNDALYNVLNPSGFGMPWDSGTIFSR